MSFDPIDHDLERGLANRRRVLGDAWVERSLSGANSFNVEFQQLISRFAWHEIWSRPGLDHKTRRIIVLSITIAMGRWEEFDLHVRSALLGEESSRLTPDEIKEVLMQAAIYAGVPAANTAFSHVMAILREVGEQIGYDLQAFSALDVSHPGTGTEGRSTSKPALHYSIRRARNGLARNTVVLSHALGCDLTMWDRLASQLAADHDVIVYDHRGHGSSDAPDGLYAMKDLAEDAARLLRELDCGPVVWIGLSMGGMVGQELAIAHPELICSLVIANCTSGYPEAARENWRQRIRLVQSQGIEAVADAVMQRYFHDAFRREHAGEVAAYRRRLVATDPQGYIGCCHAVGNVDITDRLDRLSLPVLVIAGRLDQGAPLEMSEIMASRIAGAQLVVLEDASHIAVVEQPQAFAAAVQAFLVARVDHAGKSLF